MKLYPFKAAYPNLDLIASSESFFKSVSKEFLEFRKAGFFKESNEKSLFIYRIKGLRTYTGIIGSNEISDMEDRKILGHEHTITDKEQTMLSLMLSRKAMIKPVLLAYHGHLDIDTFIENFINTHEPFFSICIEQSNEAHYLWNINDPDDIASVRHLFERCVSKAYIADGHHRASVTTMLVQKNYLHDHDDDKHPGLLCAFFPFSDLTIYDYNRVVSLAGQISHTAFMAALSVVMDIKQCSEGAKPKEKHSLTLFLNNEWYTLTWKDKVIKENEGLSVLLDVDLFNRYILGNILKVNDVKTATNIEYVDGVAGIDTLMNIVKGQPEKAGFYLYPVSKEDVIKTSEEGGVLPPKSTWFEPRMKNGMIIKEF